ncbi:hypothetical protein [Lactobacillus intestinalis]|uniref:hypothetical protein n=1 Tax=Lactobacillus intestinalis TaxID=151781 RepID=UPI0002CA1729|nr:hypothetical protein [Lactobacillus intestinalis]KAI4308842.1 hypothetical protein C821_000510 [Lactobacillus intestinalis]
MLAMHGVPLELTQHATRDQLNVLWEIVNREEKRRLDNQISATSLGVWGGEKK